MIAPKSGQVGTPMGWAGAGTPLVLFVILGMPAGAFGVAWPHMRETLGAPLAGLGLLLAAFTVAYFVASAGSGLLSVRLGMPVLLVGGCLLATAGLLGLSLAPSWWMVPVVTLLLGGGSGLIDAAVNAHTSLNRGVRYMGWLHASWAVGAALGPPVVVISIGATGSWRASFAAMAAVFMAIGVIVGWRSDDWADRTAPADGHVPATRPVPPDYRRAVVFLLGLFVVGGGLEATAGDWSYTQLTAGRSLSAGLASSSASLYWVGLAGGRVALGLLGNRVAPVRLLDAGVALGAVGALLFWLAPAVVAGLVALPILGVAVSGIFPLLISDTPARVGAGMTTHVVGFELAAGTLGGGGLPALVGLALQSLGLLTLGPLMTAMAVGLLLLHVISRLR